MSDQYRVVAWAQAMVVSTGETLDEAMDGADVTTCHQCPSIESDTYYTVYGPDGQEVPEESWDPWGDTVARCKALSARVETLEGLLKAHGIEVPE